jgi:hypothetical protein
LKKIFLLLIKFYQKKLSFEKGLLGQLFPNKSVCKYFPSCSQYTYDAIEKYGIIFGVYKGVKRILRCNNFFEGGVDPLK